MAQSVIGSPTETVLVECRAFVFYYNTNTRQWSNTGEPDVHSRVQLLCSPFRGSTRYRIVGWLESSEVETLNIRLNAKVYCRFEAACFLISIDQGTVFALRMSSESDGIKFFNIVQDILQSLQDNPVPLSLVPAVSEGIPAGPPPTPKAAWGMYPSIPMKTAPMPAAPIIFPPRTTAPLPAAPKTNAPMTNAPMTYTPIIFPPRTTAPLPAGPKTNAPMTNAPMTYTPIIFPPRTTAPLPAAPKTNAPMTNAPMTYTPIIFPPRTTAPLPAAPKTNAPMTNAPMTNPQNGLMLASMPASRPAPDGSTIMYARRSQRRDQEACMVAYGLDSQTTERMETEQLLEGRVSGQERVLQEQLRQKEQQETSLREQLRQKEGQEIILRERLRRKEQQEINLQEQLRQKEQQEINLQERLRQKEQQETSFQEQLRQKEQQETRSQEQLRQKEQQETRLQERLRQKDQQETTFQERLRQKDQQETRLRERLRQKEQQETRFQERLRQKEQQETSLQGQLRGRDNELQELRVTLSTTQQALDEQRRRELRDWVIDQDEIHLTEKCLGVGGWARVVEGTFRGYKVAVKQIHELILSSHNRGLFEREMNMASRCRHPCLLQFIGATNDDPSPMFVTELMETSLRALLQPGPLPETEIFTISLDVAQALNYLHLNRPSPIIHRDISSANVLLWRQGDQWRGKVSDYGTANFLRETMTIAPGAPIYCAPEALTSSQTIKVDVYSFGVLLCEMCIGEMPDPERRDEQISRVQNRLLRGLIRRCVHTEPGTRPTMENIIGELEQHSASS